MINDVELLATIFKQGPLKDWVYEEIVGDKLMRFAQAYLMMARDLEYRPAKPSDSPPETRDASTYIYQEAVAYAMDFASAEDGDIIFYVGSSCYNANRAFVF